MAHEQAGNPNNGRLIFIIGIAIAVVCIGYPCMVAQDYSGVIVLVSQLCSARSAL
jgi:hypothetical protein